MILDVAGLKVYFPIHGGVFLRKVGEIKAVDGVSFAIERGETLGLVGESGCGKTTVGKSIINLVPPTAGRVRFHPESGEPAHPPERNPKAGGVPAPSRGPVDLAKLSRKEMRPHRANIQMIFQDPYSSLNPRMSVGAIVEEPLRIHEPDMKPAEREERVAWVLEKVGLTGEQAARYPHEFSGGQRQRVGIARALATKPSFIIADEPVSALDVSIQAQVINLLQDLQEDFKLTYLFIAHDISVVEHIADRIAVMYLGDIVEIGESKAVAQDPIHPYSRALLSAVPRPDPAKKRRERVILKGDVPSPLAKPSGCGFRTRCPMAKDECAKSVPELQEKSPGHFVACPHV